MIRAGTARRILAGLAALLALAAPAASPGAAAPGESVTVFAAASLKTALDAVAADYEAATGVRVLVSYAGSNALAKQIEAGAPADIFLSADLAWMDYLEERGLIRAGARRVLLGNAIVLVAPAGAAAPLDLRPGADLAAALGAEGRIAMANVDSVPAGRYGKAALEALGLWQGVAGRVVQADNVRAALAFVATGEAALGVVYRTDAVAEPRVRVVAVFPEDSHPPVLYPAAILAASASPAAAAFFAFLQSAGARPAFEKAGFAVIAPGA